MAQINSGGNGWLRKLIRHPVFQFFASLKLAVFTLLSLSAVLAVATVLESYYGTRAVYVMIYGTLWFYGLLGFLCVNVLCAALSRYPWKRHQLGFLITHFGIITILVGSWLTMQFGVDGNLPVIEGQRDNEVILSDLKLSLTDEDTGRKVTVPFPESGRSREGNVLEVDLAGGKKIRVEKYFPRAFVRADWVTSPIEGMGVPAVHVQLSNSRFQIDEWLSISHPEKPSEINLGPAVISLRQLWSEADKKEFFSFSPKKEDSEAPKQIGYLIVEIEGKTYRVEIDGQINRWQEVAGTELELRIINYYPFAVVQDNQLASKSDEPKNPAVQLWLRDKKGNQEKHSIFAVFPEFNTLHRKDRKGEVALGAKIRMVSAAVNWMKSQNEPGRGRLMLAQSPGNDKLFVRIFGREGDLKHEGELASGEEIPTGWMDLKLRVLQWLPSGVQRNQPVYVDNIQGSTENFLNSVYIVVDEGRDVATDSSPQGTWVMEGGRRTISVADRKLLVELNREMLALPFFLRLNKFHIGMNPGTQKAGSYESTVIVEDAAAPRQDAALISMNEPLKYGGYTLYQASYSLRGNQPPVSIFSVNYDPGRMVKYAGSLIMCLGIMVMFYFNPHYWDILFKGKPKS